MGTSASPDAFLGMSADPAHSPRPVWLVANANSGSNDEAARDQLEECCAAAGFHVIHLTEFPRYDLPTPAMLKAAGADLLAVYAGDGTVNAVISALAGWDGCVLVLPGGTMNLLYHRLNGERTMEQVIAAVASGKARRCRPQMIGSSAGQALAGLMAGPGTSWNRVREAMRENAVIAMAAETLSAIDETLDGARIAVARPQLGSRDGYPLLMLNPQDDGIAVLGFYAETAAEYLDQGFALLRRDFRQGPHEELGTAEKLVLRSSDGKPFGLLIDGEPAKAAAEMEFALAECELDLLATDYHG